MQYFFSSLDLLFKALDDLFKTSCPHCHTSGCLIKHSKIYRTGHNHGWPPASFPKISKPDKIIIATDMDEQGRKFAKTIETMIGKVNCSAPAYNAKTKPRWRSLAGLTSPFG